MPITVMRVKDKEIIVANKVVEWNSKFFRLDDDGTLFVRSIYEYVKGVLDSAEVSDDHLLSDNEDVGGEIGDFFTFLFGVEQTTSDVKNHQLFSDGSLHVKNISEVGL